MESVQWQLQEMVEHADQLEDSAGPGDMALALPDPPGHLLYMWAQPGCCGQLYEMSCTEHYAALVAESCFG